ncbi:hypothetical protein MRX96_024198 [Rhipicephalus microplus]
MRLGLFVRFQWKALATANSRGNTSEVQDSNRCQATTDGDKPRVVPGTNVDTAAVDDDPEAASKLSADARDFGPGATRVEMNVVGGMTTKGIQTPPTP